MSGNANGRKGRKGSLSDMASIFGNPAQHVGAQRRQGVEQSVERGVDAGDRGNNLVGRAAKRLFTEFRETQPGSWRRRKPVARMKSGNVPCRRRTPRIASGLRQIQ